MLINRDDNNKLLKKFEEQIDKRLNKNKNKSNPNLDEILSKLGLEIKPNRKKSIIVQLPSIYPNV